MRLLVGVISKTEKAFIIADDELFDSIRLEDTRIGIG